MRTLWCCTNMEKSCILGYERSLLNTSLTRSVPKNFGIFNAWYFCQKIAVSFKVHEITEHVIGLFVSIMSGGAKAHLNMVYKLLRIISHYGQLCDNHGVLTALDMRLGCMSLQHFLGPSA